MLTWFKTRNRESRPANTRRALAAVRSPVRLQLEALEDRWVPSAVTHVQELGTAHGNGAATLTITAPAAVVAGDTIFVSVVENGSIGIGIAASDARGNTYHADLNVNAAANPTLLFSTQVTTALAAGDAITVTFTGAAPTESAASASEFSGLLPVSPLDQTQSATGTSNAVSSGPTATTAQTKELLIGIVEANATTNTSATPPGITFVPGTNYAALSSAQALTSFFLPPPQASFGYTLQVNPEFQVVSAAGKYAADGTVSVTAGNFSWAAGIATYKAADTTAQFSITASDANPAAGVPFSVTVTAQDAAKATATGYTGTVHLTSSDPQATLPGDYTFTAADKGVHTFTGITLKAVGTQTVTATDTNAAAGFKATVSVNAGSQNQKFVSRLYADLLGRPVDAGGLAFWSKALDGGADRTQVVSQIENTPEYLGNQANKAFNLLLKRNIDANGKTFYVNFLQTGGTDEQMIAQIAASPEYFTTRANSDTATYVQTVFQDLLNRPLDANGQAFFTKALANGATRGNVATAILTSLEYRKNLVAADYQTVLRRGPDFGAVDWVVMLLQGAPDEQINAGIFASGEYYNRA